MSAKLFGPDPERKVTETDLFLLPSTWMTAACMDDSFRRASGWLGSALASGACGAFTCRMKGIEGIFALMPCSASTDKQDEAHYTLFYFPAPDEPLVEKISIPSALALCEKDIDQKIRNFPFYPDFANLYNIGQIGVRLSRPHKLFAVSLTAATRKRIVVPNGIKAADGRWVVEPNSNEEDYSPFDLAQKLFSVLLAGLVVASGQNFEGPFAYEDKAPSFIRNADGSLTSACDEQAKTRTEIFCADPALLSFWPKAERSNTAHEYRLLRVLSGLEAPTQSDLNQMERPALVVLSGFLGSGKTSFLNQLVEFYLSHNQLVGVIQNELGQTGVDALLLEGDESVIAMDDGCVCCTLSGGLSRGLRQLADSVSPDIVVLETSGVANPMNMLPEFELLSDQANLSAVITIIDSSRFKENMAVSDIAREQVVAADIIVLNKCDLVLDPDLDSIEAEIHRLAPDAQIVRSVHGRVPASLFATGISRHAHAKHEDACMCSACSKHATNHKADGLSALRINLKPSLDRGCFLNALSTVSSNVIRGKGLVSFNDGEKPEVVQYLPDQIACEPVAKQTEQAPFLLLIGKDLDKDALLAYWSDFLSVETLS